MVTRVPPSSRMRSRVILGCWLASCALAAATPARDPHRLVNGRGVDLTPLLKWWAHRQGARPLSAWVHLKGTVVRTNSWGWVVQGEVETRRAAGEDDSQAKTQERSARVLLLDPPVNERVEFERLTSQLKALEAQRGQIANQQTEAKARADALGKQQRALRRAHSRSREIALEGRQVRAEQDQAKARLKPLDQQISALKARLSVYPTLDHYQVDCFALDTRRKFEGMRLLDHGTIY
jgi:chromosome segregation ATPase